MAGEGLVGLAERLQGLCLGGGTTVATAESCTGGAIADAITDVPGSSEYFVGGIVSYADLVKERQLGVPAAMIAAHGAVSAQVARAMATGARERLGATYAVAVTGIAGPGGATPTKPVGLTYVAVADAAGCEVRRYAWSGDRASNKVSSARAALELLVARVERGPAPAHDTSDAGRDAPEAAGRPDEPS